LKESKVMKATRWIRCVATAFACSTAVMWIGPALAGDVEDVNAAEEARDAVMIAQDRRAMAAILADEFIYHQPSDKVQNKAGYRGSRCWTRTMGPDLVSSWHSLCPEIRASGRLSPVDLMIPRRFCGIRVTVPPARSLS
jgi:hypothetical protein